MAESLAQQFIDHPRRNWIVSSATAVLIAVLGLPAYDSIQSSQKEYGELSTQLSDINQAVSDLQTLRVQLANVTNAKAEGFKTADQETAHELREQVVRMIRDRDCRVRRVTLSDPQSRPWMREDDPFATTSSNNGSKTDFQLTTTHLSVSASGTLPKLSQILTDVTTMHDYAVPTRMTLRNDGSKETVSLEMEFSLFHLDRPST